MRGEARSLRVPEVKPHLLGLNAQVPFEPGRAAVWSWVLTQTEPSTSCPHSRVCGHGAGRSGSQNGGGPGRGSGPREKPILLWRKSQRVTMATCRALAEDVWALRLHPELGPGRGAAFRQTPRGRGTPPPLPVES